MKKMIAIIVICLAWGFWGCEKEIPQNTNADAQGHTPATPVTAAANELVLGELPFSENGSGICINTSMTRPSGWPTPVMAPGKSRNRSNCPNP